MAEPDLKTSAHLFKHLQVGFPTRGTPDLGRGWLSPSGGTAKEGGFGRTRLLKKGWSRSEVWPMRATWLCQAGIALAWHNFSSSRTPPWRRDVLLGSVTRDVTSLLPQSRGFARGGSPDPGSTAAVLVS